MQSSTVCAQVTNPSCYRRNTILLLGLAIIFAALFAVYNKGPYKRSSRIRPYIQSNVNWKRDSGGLLVNFTQLNHKGNEQHGYVFALSYSGQQGAGIQALISLQCLVASFNLPMLILEPIMSKTAFVSFPSDLKNSQFLTFSNMFDIEHFNAVSKSLGYPLVGTREDFFTAAPRNAIYVQVMLAHDDQIQPPKVVWGENSKPNEKQKCRYYKTGRLMQLDEQEGFCFVRVVAATSTQRQILKISDKDVQEVIFGEWPPHQVTLIFSQWKTPWYVANNKLENPTECRRVGKSSNKKQFLPSAKLSSDAMYYENHYLSLGRDSTVALMLRLERMLEYVQQPQHSTEWTVDKCLIEAFKLAKAMKTSGYPFVTMDLGRFGSSSFKSDKHLTATSKLLLSELYDNKMSFEEWEESFTNATGGVEHRGYIAALQRTLASRAKCLILVGGGNFQDLALKDYLKNHPNIEDQCIHLVCAKNEIPLNEVING